MDSQALKIRAQEPPFLMVLFCSVLVLPVHNMSTKDIVQKFATGIYSKHTIQCESVWFGVLMVIVFGVGLITAPDCAFHSLNDVKGK